MILALLACSRDTGLSSEPGTNVVLILTDDQRADEMFAMPLTVAALGDAGVSFDHAYVGTPMCCPVRASILSGGYTPAHSGVLSNESPNGGFKQFKDEDSLAVRLHDAGYSTGMIGKYLNGYEDTEPYMPRGWDTWTAMTGELLYNGWQVVDGGDKGTPEVYSDATYLTDFLSARSNAFVTQHKDEAFFLMVTPLAPHQPAEAAPEDVGAYDTYTYDAPSVSEEDRSDKPAWVQAEEYDPTWHTQDLRDAISTLPAVDRLVDSLVRQLDEDGVLDRTVIIFSSDNGFHWGEHGLWGKGSPYEESIRVPLYVRAPDAEVRSTSALVAANLDLPATIEDLAGIGTYADGQSLVDLVRGETDTHREGVHIDYYTDGYPVWAGWETERWTYVEYGTGETELYDRDADPYQLDNLASAPGDAPVSDFAAKVEAERGLAITTDTLPAATPGVAYTETLGVWGAQGTLTWEVDGGALPAGMSLSTDGVLSGTPTEEESASFQLRVTDSAKRPYTGETASFARGFVLEVGAPALLGPPEPTVEGDTVTLRARARRPITWTLTESPDPAFDLRAHRHAPVVTRVGDTWELRWTFPARGRWWWKLENGTRGSVAADRGGR